jgi:hypothetical protein
VECRLLLCDVHVEAAVGVLLAFAHGLLLYISALLGERHKLCTMWKSSPCTSMPVEHHTQPVNDESHTGVCSHKCLQVAGLWYILGIALALAVLITAVKRIEYHFWLKSTRARRATKQQQTAANTDPSQSPCTRPYSPPGDVTLEEPCVRMLSLTVKQQRAHAYVHAHATTTSRFGALGMFPSSGDARSSGDGQHSDCVAEFTLPPGGVASYAGDASAAPAEDGHAAAPSVGECTAVDTVQQVPRAEAALDS